MCIREYIIPFASGSNIVQMATSFKITVFYCELFAFILFIYLIFFVILRFELMPCAC
jgi:hypothetical protein